MIHTIIGTGMLQNCRIGWRWLHCKVNWLDPEPATESEEYQLYCSELRRETSDIGMYKGYHQPPTEEEYRGLCSTATDSNLCMSMTTHQNSMIQMTSLLVHQDTTNKCIDIYNDEYYLWILLPLQILPSFHLLPARPVLPAQSIEHCFRMRLMITFEEWIAVHITLNFWSASMKLWYSLLPFAGNGSSQFTSNW